MMISRFCVTLLDELEKRFIAGTSPGTSARSTGDELAYFGIFFFLSFGFFNVECGLS